MSVKLEYAVFGIESDDELAVDLVSKETFECICHLLDGGDHEGAMDIINSPDTVSRQESLISGVFKHADITIKGYAFISFY